MHAKRIISKPRITVSNHGMDVFIVFYTNNSLCNIFSDYVFFFKSHENHQFETICNYLYVCKMCYDIIFIMY